MTARTALAQFGHFTLKTGVRFQKGGGVIFYETYIFFALAVFEEYLKMAVLVRILLQMPNYHYEPFRKKDL